MLFAALFLAASLVAAEPWLDYQLARSQHDCAFHKRWAQASSEAEHKARALAAEAYTSDPARELAVQAAVKAHTSSIEERLRADAGCRRFEALAGLAARSQGATALPLFLEGDVQVKAAEGWKRLDDKTPIPPGQTLRTGAKSAAMLVFPGLVGDVRIGPNSMFTPTQTALRLDGGVLEYAADELDASRGRAPVLRVRGIDAAVRDARLVLSARGAIVRLAVFAGEAVVPGQDGAFSSISAGYRVAFKDGRMTGRPEKFKSVELQEWLDN